MNESLNDALRFVADLGPVVLVSQVLDSLSPCGVRVDTLADLGETKSVGHAGCED